MVWSRSCPAASLPVPSAKPPTLLVSRMVSLLPLKEWLLINGMKGLDLIPPTSGPELIPRSCVRPRALEKSHPRIRKWEETLTCCRGRINVRKRGLCNRAKVKEKCTEEYHSMVADEGAKFAPSTDSNQLSQMRETGLMLVGEALWHRPQWPLPFVDSTQEQDSPCSARTVPRSWPDKQVMDEVQTERPENVSVQPAWHQWSF